ncbi:MAG: Molybdopterin-synthase adenylyltransferase [Candidatus Erwinia impunctatus]|nr:Molybdopterin-synthase adenylyltransferase [Culicoides impunctatus]
MGEELNKEEMLRYHRQISLKGFDFEGQEKLKLSRVLIIGLGGLGCAAATYLVSAGVGNVTLLDFDHVSLSNMQRQFLHHDALIGHAKVFSAQQQLALINPHCVLNSINQQLTESDLMALIAKQDLIVDCTDNLITREQINLGCFTHKIPLVSGAAIRMEGQVACFTWRKQTACYHCISRLFTESNLSCSEAGVMAPLVGVIGSLQAMEAIKILTEYGQTNRSNLLFYDAMSLEFRRLNIGQDPLCEVCGTDCNPTLTQGRE